MNEVWRVLRPDGIFWFRVPNALEWFDGAFETLPTKRYFTPRSFTYLCEMEQWESYGRYYGFKGWRKFRYNQGKEFFELELIPRK